MSNNEKSKNVTLYEQEARNELVKCPGGEISVTNQASYEAAGKLLVEIATVKKNIKACFADPKKKAAEAHKAICALENELLAKASAPENAIRQKMEAFHEAEQKRLAAERERQRQKAEEAARLAAEAEAAGDTETAMEAVALAAITESTVTAAPKAAGVSMREVWEAVVTDKSKVPLEYMEVNMSALNAIAKATKGILNIPGVQFVKKTVSSVRGK